MTSLECIFAVEKISGGNAAIECYVEKEKSVTSTRQPKANSDGFLLRKVRPKRLCGRAGWDIVVECNARKEYKSPSVSLDISYTSPISIAIIHRQTLTDRNCWLYTRYETKKPIIK